MRCQQMLRLIGLPALAVLLLVRCSPDCEWSAVVQTWVDRNENAVWDAGEPPLPNVKCFVESFKAAGTAQAVSNEKGEARLYVLLAGCPREVAFFIYVLPPSSYRMVTQTTIPAKETDERVFQFGFVPVGE